MNFAKLDLLSAPGAMPANTPMFPESGYSAISGSTVVDIIKIRASLSDRLIT